MNTNEITYWVTLASMPKMWTIHPKAPWSVELAMARNAIIYGLASEIYAAQSDSKGGTWSGVIEGLKKGQTVYVRVPSANEKNANKLLIEKGGIGVDLHGNIKNDPFAQPVDLFNYDIVSEPANDTVRQEDNEKKITSTPSGGLG